MKAFVQEMQKRIQHTLRNEPKSDMRDQLLLGEMIIQMYQSNLITGPQFKEATQEIENLYKK